MRLRAAIVLAAAISGGALPALGEQPGGGAIVRYDAAGEVSSAVYQMSTLVEALKVEHSAEIRAKDGRIRKLQGELAAAQASSTDAKRLGAELTLLQREVVDQLAAKDAELARQVTAFRSAVEDIASTPEGAAILAQRRPGNLRQARELLIDLEATLAAAEQKAADIRSAARLRSIATLALDDRNRGEATTQEVMALYERVTALDGVFGDWIELSRLYRAAGVLPKAEAAADKGVAAAAGDLDRTTALFERMTVRLAKGAFDDAIVDYTDARTILEAIAAADSDNLEAQRMVAVLQIRMGELLAKRGEDSLSRQAVRAALSIFQRLGASDPSNATWALDLVSAHMLQGDIEMEAGDAGSALESFESALTLAQTMAAMAPDDAVWQRALSVAKGGIGRAHGLMRDRSRAQRNMEDSYYIAARLAGIDPDNIDLQRDFAAALGGLGEFHISFEGAESALGRSLQIVRELAAAHPAHAGVQRDLAAAVERWGDLQLKRNRRDAAKAAFDEALAIRTRLFAADAGDLQLSWNIVMSYLKLGQATGDRAYFATALDLATSGKLATRSRRRQRVIRYLETQVPAQ